MQYLSYIVVTYNIGQRKMLWEGMVVSFIPIDRILPDQVEFNLTEKLGCSAGSVLLIKSSLVSTSNDLPVLALLNHTCIECSNYVKSPMTQDNQGNQDSIPFSADNFYQKRMLALDQALSRSRKVLDIIHGIIGCQVPESPSSLLQRKIGDGLSCDGMMS